VPLVTSTVSQYTMNIAGHKPIGLVTGVVAFIWLLSMPTPANVTDAGWRVAAMAALMAIWWMTEAVPLAATALVPLVVLPVLGASTLDTVAASYAHPLIFLFFGGFLIGRALERWSLHTRIATSLIKLAPRSAEGVIGAVMIATAFLSMWISNTATALVMVSIVQTITANTGSHTERNRNNTPRDQFAAAMMLGVAFAATVGGMATIIGTPPNALLVGYLQTSHNITIGFGQWMLIGVPLVVVLLPITWLLLTQVIFRMRSLDLNSIGYVTASAPPPPLSVAARIVAIIATLTALALLLRPVAQRLMPDLDITDAGILMTAGLTLLILPAPGTDGERLLEWNYAEKIRWDVLVLFGGGLALADAVEVTGLAQSIGSLFTIIAALPVTTVILMAMVTMVLIGELASNTAMAAVFLPIVGAAALAMGVPPLELIIPIGLAASIGFMLPVATPPNAIAYGSGAISSGQLLKAGSLLDIVSIAVVYCIAVLLGPVVFG